MNKSIFPRSTALSCVLASLFLSSCELPTREALHLRDDGLVAFLTGKWKENSAAPRYQLDGAPPALVPEARQAVPAATLVAAEAKHDQPVSPIKHAPVVEEPRKATPPPRDIVAVKPKPALESSRPTPTPAPSVAVAKKQPAAPSKPAPSNSESPKNLTAQSVASLPGFVRSPYTNPPRLVDVKGSAPGATVVCPYTQRTFIIPSDFKNPVSSAIASAPPVVKPQPEVAKTRPAPQQSATVAPKTPATVASNTPEVPKTEAPKPSEAKPKAEGAPLAKLPEVKPVPEIPTASAISGRPGFVNSPYAAKHQIVDVTGLPAGMEVKCPYTGKLFRVPAQEVVSTKTVEPPKTKVLASPEPEKKDKK